MFEGLGKFGVIYADCPWHFSTWSDKGRDRSPDQHYPCMSMDDLRKLPVQTLAAPDCVLLIWIIDTLLPQGLDLIKTWGFTYKTVGFTWVKANLDGSYFMGLGYHTRANPERCYLATRGKPKRLARNVPELIVSHRYRHSQKPSVCYERIEALYPGPFCELFARPRTRRPNWTYWGNEVK